nr:MAG TPA: hypothetical protein [Caudoviricetes sp.]
MPHALEVLKMKTTYQKRGRRNGYSRILRPLPVPTPSGLHW